MKTPEERQAELDAREAKLDARERRQRKAAAKARLKGHRTFADQLKKDGRILPRHTDLVVGLLGALPADAQVAMADSETGEDEDVPAAEALQSFLKELPKQVEYAEVAGSGRKPPRKGSGGSGSEGRFQVPGDQVVSEDKLELHEQVLDYAAKHNVTYEQALTKVTSDAV